MKALLTVGVILVILVSVSLVSFTYLFLGSSETALIGKRDGLSSDFEILLVNEDRILIRNIGSENIEKGEIIVHIDGEEATAIIPDSIDIEEAGVINIPVESDYTELMITGPEGPKIARMGIPVTIRSTSTTSTIVPDITTTTIPENTSTTILKTISTTTTLQTFEIRPAELWEEEFCTANGKVAINFHWNYNGQTQYFILSAGGMTRYILNDGKQSEFIYDFSPATNITWTITAVKDMISVNETRTSKTIYCNPPTTTTSSTSTTTTHGISGNPTTTTTSASTTISSTSTPSTSTTMSCSCGAWVNQGCELGGCSSSRMYQTRTCNPASCSSQSRCTTSAICGPSTTTSTSTTITVSSQPLTVEFFVIIPADYPDFSGSPNPPVSYGSVTTAQIENIANGYFTEIKNWISSEFPGRTINYRLTVHKTSRTLYQLQTREGARPDEYGEGVNENSIWIDVLQNELNWDLKPGTPFRIGGFVVGGGGWAGGRSVLLSNGSSADQGMFLLGDWGLRYSATGIPAPGCVARYGTGFCSPDYYHAILSVGHEMLHGFYIDSHACAVRSNPKINQGPVLDCDVQAWDTLTASEKSTFIQYNNNFLPST